MIVNINTKMIALLGKPLSQSYSARIQNAAYKAAGIDMLYFYSEVENSNLPDVVNGIRHMGFAGFAVTKPNKIEIMKYVDEKDTLCKKMNASNTVVKLPDGKLKAYNTDGTGFIKALNEEKPNIDIKESIFFCIGAGGAGRAISSALAYCGAKKIYIANRTNSKAEQLVDDINKNFEPVAEFVNLNDTILLKDKINESNVVLNNTGLGMFSSIEETPIPKNYLHSELLCFDATYNPLKTRFLIEAEEMGCSIMNGLGMFLYQGAEQIELWSGKPAPIEVMRQEIINIVSEKEEE